MEKIGPGLVALLTSLLDESERYLDSADIASNDMVHQCRRNGKRIIALLELLRASADKPLFSRLHDETREANRLLAKPRRATVLLAALQKVDVPAATKADLERQLMAQCTPDAGVVAEVARCVRSVRTSLAVWPCDEIDPDTVRRQLERSRAKLRNRRKRACKKPSPKRLHALRTRLRRYSVQLKTLQQLDVSRKRRFPKKLSKLDPLLGKVNDLHDLEQLVAADSEGALAPKRQKELLRSIIKRRKRKTRDLVRTHLD